MRGARSWISRARHCSTSTPEDSSCALLCSSWGSLPRSKRSSAPVGGSPNVLDMAVGQRVERLSRAVACGVLEMQPGANLGVVSFERGQKADAVDVRAFWPREDRPVSAGCLRGRRAASSGGRSRIPAPGSVDVGREKQRLVGRDFRQDLARLVDDPGGWVQVVGQRPGLGLPAVVGEPETRDPVAHVGDFRHGLFQGASIEVAVAEDAPTWQNQGGRGCSPGGARGHLWQAVWRMAALLGKPAVAPSGSCRVFPSLPALR